MTTTGGRRSSGATRASADHEGAPVGPVVRVRRIVDIEGAAEHLTVSVRYMRTLVADRRIPHLKVGKYVRFDLDELDDWLDGCRREAS